MVPSDQQKRDSIHEAGHAVLAKLFENEFTIKSITLDPQLYANNMNVAGWRGGIHISAKGKPKSVENPDKLVVIMWGGLCSQNICIIGLGNLNTQVINRMSVFWKQELDQEGCEGDFEFTSPKIRALSIRRGIPQSEYELSIVNFILQFQSRPEVWKAIEALSEKILQKDNLTIDSNEIEFCFKASGLHDFIVRNRNSIISERYNLIMPEANETSFEIKSTNSYWRRFIEFLKRAF
jgi:hypothetical protein